MKISGSIHAIIITIGAKALAIQPVNLTCQAKTLIIMKMTMIGMHVLHNMRLLSFVFILELFSSFFHWSQTLLCSYWPLLVELERPPASGMTQERSPWQPHATVQSRSQTLALKYENYCIEILHTT